MEAVDKPNVEDLIVPSLAEEPWQYKPYTKYSATWQAAAQLRHQHRRRTDTVIGVASVDLSGPHEPTPVPGARQLTQGEGHYFLALTIYPDLAPKGIPLAPKHQNGRPGRNQRSPENLIAFKKKGGCRFSTQLS